MRWELWMGPFYGPWAQEKGDVVYRINARSRDVDLYVGFSSETILCCIEKIKMNIVLYVRKYKIFLKILM